MASPPLALGPERGQIDGSNHNLLAGAGVCLGENPPVMVHEHTAAGQGEWGIIGGARSLVGRHDESEVLHRSRPVEQRPPVERRSRSPGVHVGRDADEDFGSGKGQRADGLGKQRVIANRGDLITVTGTRQIGLTGRGVVAWAGSWQLG
jgi:hypothetical protein